MYVVLVGLHPVEPRGFDEFGGSVAKRLSSPPADSYPKGKANDSVGDLAVKRSTLFDG